MPIDLIAACVGVLGTLQILSMFLTNLEIASKQIDARKRLVAKDGTVFEEFAVTELENSAILRQDFDIVSAEATQAHA